MVAPLFDTPFHAKQVKIAALEFIRNGYRLILLTIESNDDVEKLVSILLNDNVAGLMITSATPSSKIINECKRLHIPLVLINRVKKQDIADAVRIVVQQAGELAFAMLSQSGSRRMAVVHPRNPSYFRNWKSSG